MILQLTLLLGMVTKKIGLVLLVILFASATYAGERIGYNQFQIYADTSDLSFENLISLEKEGKIVFGEFNDLSPTVKVYWLQLSPTTIGNLDYLLFSNFFDRIEAYSVKSAQPFSITGRLVDFEDRSYKRGFYRHVLTIEQTKDPIYIKLISETGNSIYNRSLSHIEVCTAEDLGYQSKNILTTYTLLTGMELIILMINLFLIYLKPSKTGYSYAFVILTGILLSNFNAQIFVDMIGMSAIALNYTEQVIAVLIIYSLNLFSAYFLNVYQSSRTIHYILVFPIFPVVISSIFISNGHFFPWISTSYFLIGLVFITYSVAITWKVDAQKCKIFLLANGLSILAALVMVLALSGFIVHHFITTNAVFLGFILRDTLFTLNLFRNYFRLQDESLRRDVTIEKLREEKEQMKQIEILKTKFFNNVSHELRTPLTLILSPLEHTLKSGELPEKLKADLNLSLKNGKYLLQLVNELLDLAKLDKGELRMIRQPVNVIELIKDIAEKFIPYSNENHQTIHVLSPPGTINANLDADKFNKIMLNLLSNAIKYSQNAGHIEIKTLALNGTLEITISDQGRGIPHNDIHKIFDRYFQSENNEDTAGTGIGLSIVKEFMTLHEGSVVCKSKVGIGSTFTLNFPKAIISSEGENEVFVPDLLDSSKHTILLVEDHREMLDYLSEKLSEFNVIKSSNGNEALNKLRDGLEPDLVLTDFMMPGMSGDQLVKALKESDRWFNIPIIFLTARTLEEDKLAMLNLGVDDYIVKPFNLDELIIRIKNTLKIGSELKRSTSEISHELSQSDQRSFKTDLDTFILENLKKSGLSNFDISNHFALSERNLYRRVKLVTGQSPASYIKEIRLQRARLLLENNNQMNISEVAIECGIANANHFSQTFKKRFGKSPSAFNNPEVQ
jgi:signal transduction histidine kinase/DNA-binding response OmpR family regulator